MWRNLYSSNYLFFPAGPVPVGKGLGTTRAARHCAQHGHFSLFPAGPVPVEGGLATTAGAVVVKPISTDAGSVGISWNLASAQVVVKPISTDAGSVGILWNRSRFVR